MSLVSLVPDVSWRPNALKKCSAASLCAPMFKPTEVVSSISHRFINAAYKQRRRCRLLACMLDVIEELHGKRQGLPQVCGRWIRRNLICSIEDNPEVFRSAGVKK